MGSKKSKAERQQEREILDAYHQKVTEEALEPLYESFQQWKQGTLPYYELTERIHQFHKRNQEIYKEFEYTNRHELLLYAKMKLGRLSEQDVREHHWLLEHWGYRGNGDK